jgi:phosphoribosylanthranilate isomerase
MDPQLGACRYLVKVCGNTDEENLQGVLAGRPDLIGVIFAPESPRAVDLPRAASLARAAEAAGVGPVGVFRNLPLDHVQQMIASVGLKVVQLHGQEDVKYISDLRRLVPSLVVIKAISVESGSSLLGWEGYEGEADFLLFDTESRQGGGSGVAFDWSVLKGYNGKAPFLVAGGVGPQNVEQLLRQCRDFEKFRGVDINSAVEVRPGMKDASKTAEVIRKMRDV